MHGADPLPRALQRMGIPVVAMERTAGSHDDPHRRRRLHRGSAAAAVRHLLERGRTPDRTIAGPQDMPAGAGPARRLSPRTARHPAAVDRGDRRLHPRVGRIGDARTPGGRPEAGRRVRRVRPDGARRAAGPTPGRPRVPDDVAVVGFDDFEIAQYTDPPLTTVRQPVEEMAKALTLTLLDRIPPGRLRWTGSIPARRTARQRLVARAAPRTGPG